MIISAKILWFWQIIIRKIQPQKNILPVILFILILMLITEFAGTLDNMLILHKSKRYRNPPPIIQPI